MAQIEKSVFISYRRTNSFHALAIFQALNNNGYDVFIDYASIDSGKFDDIILDQIKARAHFIPILTPSALERCDDPNDWVRIEIMTAIQYQRNIVPVMFDGFDWKQDIISKLPDVLKGLERFNALPVPSSLLYFQTAMELLHTKFLNKPVDVVIYPPARADVSLVTQKIEVATNQPAVTQDQLNADDYFERGNQYYQNWQYDRAIPEYTQSLHLNPNNPTAYYRRGVAYEEMGQFELANADYDQAIHQADKLIHNNPQDSEAYRARGSAYDNKREYDRAIADFDEAIRLNPKFDIAYNNRGLAYDNKREYDRAIADFDEAIRLNPNYALAYNNRGVVYANQREYDRAIADFDEAIRLNPQLALAYTNRG
ncbi:MAG: tetratricopeptide repeat protein, partial [Anaerolineae bacterium]|nr:tetratricopeptide repeat protein [Anaerolineae bacterium]